MRKIVPLFLILLYTIQIFGIVVLYIYQKKQIRHEFHQFLKQNLTIEELILIKKPKNKTLNQYFTNIEKDEFCYKGSMYDIVKQYEDKDTIYYYCFNDKKEDNLHKKLVDNFNNNYDGNNLAKRSILKLAQLLTLGFLNNKLGIDPIIKQKITSEFCIKIPNNFIPDTLSPPPRIYSHS